MTAKAPENVQTINRGAIQKKKQKPYIATILSSASAADKLTKPFIMN